MNIKNITAISSYLQRLADQKENKDILRSLSELVLYKDEIDDIIDSLKGSLDFSSSVKLSNNEITVSLVENKDYDFDSDLEYLKRKDELKKRKEKLKMILSPEIKQQIKLTKNGK